MIPQSLKPPSRSEPITFPVFALTWTATPTSPNSARSIVVCSGGGGSGKHGVKNLVRISIQDDDPRVSRTVSIDTKEMVAFCVAIREVVENNVSIFWICIGTGDLVQMYTLNVIPCEGIPDEAQLVSEVNVGKGYGTNSLAFSPLNDALVVGCENGNLCLVKWNGKDLKLKKTDLEYMGHTKAVCKVEFHPTQPNIVISSAKDGTCRLWNLQLLPNEACVDQMTCSIYDAAHPPKDQKLLNPKPGQNVVKGCAFGDFEGRVVYSIQSGRKPDKTGKKRGSFLSVWKLVRRVVPLVDEKTPVSAPKERSGRKEPNMQEVLKFEEQLRVPVSNYPASAFSLSGDLSTIAIGDTDGSITLLSTTTFKPVKHWANVHDLPVTCIAARPLPVGLAGEQKYGVTVDAVSCSADNQMVFLTKQKRSTLKTSKTSDSGSSLFRFWFFLVLIVFAYIGKVSYDVCLYEFESGHDFKVAKECVVHTVLWASSNRPGVESVPF